MRKYPAFLIKVDDDDTETFYAAVMRALCNGWTFCRTFPELDSQTGYVFHREARSGWPPILLSMVRTDAETIEIINVVPKETSFSIDEYKTVLEEFRSSVLDKVTKTGFPIALQMGDDEIHLDRLLPPTPLRLLQSFADYANKNTGSSHLCDRAYWYRFLTCAHVQGHQLTPNLIGYWAREQGFSDLAASTLEHEFDFAMGLLDAIGHGQRRQEPAPPSEPPAPYA